MALIAPVWGMLSDRYGRKIMVTRAMFGGAVIICLMGFIQNVYQLTVLRAIQGMLTGTVPAATTLIASGTPSNRRGYALGMLQMAVYLGSTVGPFLGGLIAGRLGYRATFWVTGVLLLAAGILVSLLVKEEFTPPEWGRARMWEGLLLVLRALAGVSAGGILAAVNVLQASLAPGGRYGAVYGVSTA
jgi:DHA1 family multidrug resistance protein-like MFS transporter